MTITSGIGGRAFLDEFNLSGTIAQMSAMEQTEAQLDKTTIQDEAVRRLGARKDGRLATVSHFDDAAGMSHDALSEYPASTENRLLSYCHRATRGAPAWSCWGKQTELIYNRQADGDLLLNASVAGNGYGVELGHLLTAGLESSSGTEALTGVDDGAGAASDYGLQAYLHVVSFTGTDVTVTLQDSDDDAATDPYGDITGAAFTTVTGVGFERIQTGRTENVKQWIRVDLDGTYSAVELVVVVVPNRLAATVF
jgi:hypothetical protein